MKTQYRAVVTASNALAVRDAAGLPDISDFARYEVAGELAANGGLR